MLPIAIAQLNPIIGDLSGNARLILEAAYRAADAGAKLLLTPELSLCGYPPRDFLLNPGFIQGMETQLQELATQLPPEVAVLVGTVKPNPYAGERGQKALFNSIVLLRRGEQERVFEKRLLPTYDVFDEDRYFEAGDRSDYFLLDSLKIGVTICEDLWNDEAFWGERNYEVNPMADLLGQEVDLVVNLSASPYSAGKQKLREAMLGHAAQRYSCPLIYANQVGGNDDLIFDGTSVAFNRQGEVVYRDRGFQVGFSLIEYDPQKQDIAVGKIAPLPESIDAEIWSALVMGLGDYARKCGFTKALVGLSGGIDSSLVAAIAAEAFGSDNVLCVLMPSPYSSPGSLTDAFALAENLGVQTAKLPIESAMKAFDEILEPLFAGTEFGVAEENIQSRIRGNLLMAISNKFGYLLLATGNKSEMSVGYSTLYGDMSGGLAVIADVPKTQVYSLCRWRNREGEVIPETVLTKPPSAELKPEQKDEDSLPPYEILDDILHRVIEKQESATNIVEAGHDRETVEKVLKMLSRAEFKRRQAPPALKITPRAFGTGWRMPIASRFY